MGDPINMFDKGAWDDTVLIDSWNEAYEEFKHYHSLQARGIKVEDALRAADEAEKLQTAAAQSKQAEVTDETMDGVENGEISEGEVKAENHQSANPAIADNIGSKLLPAPPSTGAQNPDSAPLLPPMQNFASSIPGPQSEAVKNLMMSWYYAGYYAGLYEGEQKAWRNFNQMQVQPQAPQNHQGGEAER